MNACVLLRRESIVATPDPSLSLSLLRDEQKVSLGELLTVVKCQFLPSTKHEKGLKYVHQLDIGVILTEFHEFW